jgi:hypothetical protein
MAALTFLGLLGGGCVLILALSNLVTNLRRAQVADHLEHANGNGNGLLAADDYAHLEPLSQDLQPAGRASGSRAPQEF